MKRISINFGVQEAIVLLREMGENVSKNDATEIRQYERDLGEDMLEAEDLGLKQFSEIDYCEGDMLKVLEIRLITGKIYHIFHDDFYIYAAHRLEMYRPEKFIIPFN